MATTWKGGSITRRSALLAAGNAFAVAALAMAGCGSKSNMPAGSMSANGQASMSASSEAGMASEMARSFGERADVAKSFGATMSSQRGYQVFHVRTPDFQFDLPSYWQGRVEWFERTLSNGYTEVSICPIGMTERTSSGNYEFALVTVTATDANADAPGGDIGGGLVAHVDGRGKDVVVYQKNWTFIGREHGPSASSGMRKYSEDQLDRLIGLATGGKLGYADCRSTANDTACLEYNSSQFKNKITIGNYASASPGAKTANEFILPDTNLVDYNIRIWHQMDDHKLFLVRNEIFARHGCGFKSQELRDCFRKQAWYKETIDAGTYGTEILNSAEKLNVENILAVEKKRNSPYI